MFHTDIICNEQILNMSYGFDFRKWWIRLERTHQELNWRSMKGWFFLTYNKTHHPWSFSLEMYELLFSDMNSVKCPGKRVRTFSEVCLFKCEEHSWRLSGSDVSQQEHVSNMRRACRRHDGRSHVCVYSTFTGSRLVHVCSPSPDSFRECLRAVNSINCQTLNLTFTLFTEFSSAAQTWWRYSSLTSLHL